MKNIISHVKYIRKSIDVIFGRKLLFATNVGISISLSAAGDIIEQKLEKIEGYTNQWDTLRTRNMALSGMTIGVFCHHWYFFLEKYMPGRTIGMVMKKVVVDQLICSPICITTFFLTLGYLEKTKVPEIIDEIKRKAIILYTAEWVVWPPAQVINFYILPIRYRVLYDNIISLGYDVYTSRVRHTHP